MWREGLNPQAGISDAVDVDPLSDQPDLASSPAALAHELNNLLDGSLKTVTSAARTLRDGGSERSTDDVLRRLITAEQLLQRMAGLIEAMAQGATHSFSSSSLPPTARTQTLGEAIDHALQCVEAEANEAGVVLDALVDPRLASLPADALYTVVSNGLHNAIESIRSVDAAASGGRKSGRIELRLQQDERDVVLTIADNGPGVDPSLRTPGGGFRFGVTTKADGHGIGLGLSRQVAMALGGRLWLRDRRPSGALLTLRFPVASLREARGGEGRGVA